MKSPKPAMTFPPADIDDITAGLSNANKAFAQRYPGESNRRQAVHTVYGGGHLFRSDTAQQLGAVALQSLQDYAPNADLLAQALGMGDPALAEKVYTRVLE